ncbi:MAG: hypothetical protein P4M01_07835 [Acidobacteriota bacterium]|nr:hypothetical protein [Acidobacteriota bacterium]
MTRTGKFRGSRTQRSLLLGFVALFLLFATIQAVHFHLHPGSEESAHCSMCMATHSVADVAPIVLPGLVALALVAITVHRIFLPRAVHTATRIRPPPVCSLQIAL